MSSGLTHMIPFTKMHGAGNDYVYIDGARFPVSDPSALAQKVSDRHFGVGSDGLVLILPSDSSDFRMRMFNADGSEAEMCGNAARCVGKYVFDHQLTDKTHLTLQTLAGEKQLELYVQDGLVQKVRVDMGEPVLVPDSIPVALKGDQIVGFPLLIKGVEYPVTCVSMGNPHAVVFMQDVMGLNLPVIGPEFEHHVAFSKKINTEFVLVVHPGLLKMRVWERGAGETLACGTGACASLVAGVLNGLCNRQATVRLLGGDLEIEWNASDNHVYMTGEAVTVFEGEFLSDIL